MKNDLKKYQMELTRADDVVMRLSGTLKGKRLTLVSKPDPKSGDVYRATLTMLNPKRSLLMLQKQRAGRGPFQRLYEIGYTRRGTRLASDTTDGPECIVTGGLGTIAVKHEGQTYYVCCTGCRQVFDEDPAKTVSEYQAMKLAAQGKSQDP